VIISDAGKDGVLDYIYEEGGMEYTVRAKYKDNMKTIITGLGTYMFNTALATAEVTSVKMMRKEIFNNGGRVQVNFDTNSNMYISDIKIKTRGICTRTVAYAMKTLLDVINKNDYFAPSGSVHIETEVEHALPAFNCYSRAFKLNGYEMDPVDYGAFKHSYYEARDFGGVVSIILNHYRNPDQQQKEMTASIRRQRIGRPMGRLKF